MAEQRLIAAAEAAGDREKTLLEHVEDRELSSRGTSTSSNLSNAAAPLNADRNDDDAGLLDDYPTEEEQQMLRRVPGKIPLKVFTIAFVELCERFSYYGSAVVVSIVSVLSR
jgi:hypothetical protein